MPSEVRVSIPATCIEAGARFACDCARIGEARKSVAIFSLASIHTLLV